MNNYKLRLRLTSGAEFEAEGPAEFVLSEKNGFLKSAAQTPAEPAAGKPGADNMPAQKSFWTGAVERREGALRLKIKAPGISAAEAVLILMAANQALNLKDDFSAIKLSKALKSSGYAPDRLDRLLAGEIRDGRVTASGTKRNRAYRLTSQGMAAATAAADKLREQPQ